MDKQWQGTTSGNSQMHSGLIMLLRVIDIRLIYAFAYVFVVPAYLFRPGFKYIYRYFRQRWGYGRVKAFFKTWQNHCMFSQVVIDRFAMYAGKHFHFDVEGYEHFQQLSDKSEAFIQLSSHIGNYEMAGYTLSAKKPLNALVFGGEKPSVMENRAKMFSDKNIRMIATKDDMSHLFLIDGAIQRGEIVSMPADRMFGSEKRVDEHLLGAPVKLPLGPFSVAAMRGLDVLAVNVMKSSTRGYTIYVTPLSYDREAPRSEQTAQLAHGYTTELERILRKYPTQWYNFYDFWNV